MLDISGVRLPFSQGSKQAARPAPHKVRARPTPHTPRRSRVPPESHPTPRATAAPHHLSDAAPLLPSHSPVLMSAAAAAAPGPLVGFVVANFWAVEGTWRWLAGPPSQGGGAIRGWGGALACGKANGTNSTGWVDMVAPHAVTHVVVSDEAPPETKRRAQEKYPNAVVVNGKWFHDRKWEPEPEPEPSPDGATTSTAVVIASGGAAHARGAAFSPNMPR